MRVDGDAGAEGVFPSGLERAKRTAGYGLVRARSMPEFFALFFAGSYDPAG